LPARDLRAELQHDGRILSTRDAQIQAGETGENQGNPLSCSS
jgi:hypothetical protein